MKTVGNHNTCLLGKALTCNYHRRPKYLEIDIDIASLTITTVILHLALGCVTIDMGFLVEAQEEELSERLISGVRVCQMEMPDRLPSTSSLGMSSSIEDLTAKRTREWFTMTRIPFWRCQREWVLQ
ncbi:unnamed protein product [Linum tenue]|uniref:Protein ENHANCED DISEASE RESISTANCE 2 C-terminal domain-containing protein n=1 Tax=Linum tenue TaxID=586396 RepID=A0AAV0L1H0_9ROSI|nr:unnamed protein product [Linum tenue]